MKNFNLFLAEAEEKTNKPENKDNASGTDSKSNSVDDAGENRNTEIDIKDVQKKVNQSDEEHAEDAEKGEEVDDGKKKVAIETFMSKVLAAQTKEGLDELEAFYIMRREEVKLDPSDDIVIRDAINGRRAELEEGDGEEESEDF